MGTGYYKCLVQFTFIVLIFSSNISQATVWQETDTWNSSWEQKYSDWIRNSFDEGIYTSGSFKDLPTDCADAVYYARIIFSYENKLPFVIKDATGGPNFISNIMIRFDDIQEPLQRVRKFMDFVGDVTSTKSLPNDTYPVAVNRSNIRPGTVWSRPRISSDNIWRRIFGGTVKEDPGHAEIVKEVAETGAIYLIGSTVPKAIRKLNTTSSLVFMPVETSTGFRNWMQPTYYSKSSENLPGYSLEQFKELGHTANDNRSLDSWSSEVQARLALRDETKPEFITRQVMSICSLVSARVDTVTKSEVRRAKLSGACMNADDYDSYSTPSRDKRITTTLKQLISTAGGFGLTSAQRAKVLRPYLNNACADIQISADQTISLYDFSILMLKNKVSSNPNDSFAARWGLEDSTSNCPKYE